MTRTLALLALCLPVVTTAADDTLIVRMADTTVTLTGCTINATYTPPQQGMMIASCTGHQLAPGSLARWPIGTIDVTAYFPIGSAIGALSQSNCALRTLDVENSTAQYDMQCRQ